MIYIAIVLAVFLFYKFVPKNHKILSAKVFGSLAIIIGVAMFIMNLREEMRYKERAEGITSEFLYLKPNGTNSELALKVCNKRSIPLIKYKIAVSGVIEGRSTKFKLLKDYSDEGSTSFDSDIIIPPNNCTVVAWNGNFSSFNNYISYPETYAVEWNEN